jgi:hypothetical protein
MDILNPNDLQSLIGVTGNRCISLYMPTHRFGPEQQEDPIRLKNLLAEAEAKLTVQGIRRPQIQKLMRPAEELLWNSDFWRYQSEGLAVFLSTDFSRIYRLPVAFEELLVIANNFHIKPLLSLFNKDGRFYILALSLNKIRLFSATRDSISEIALSIPTAMRDFLWMDEPERQLQFHSTSNASGGAKGQSVVFHGQGIGEQDKTNILRFFQFFNQKLSPLLEDKTIPMLLAGVDYLLPIYEEANIYPNLLTGRLIGNPEKENIKELHGDAWQIVEPTFEENQRRAVEKFEQLKGQQSNLVTSDLKTAVQAAKFGRVETLFVPLGVQKWGRYDVENNKVILEDEPTSENEDLLDFAAAQTILNSGQVFAVQPDELPGNGDLAAFLRYSA